MPFPEPDSAMLAEVRRVPVPRDYLAETRTSLGLHPDKILCFTRRGRRNDGSESLVRHHHHRHVLVVPWQETGEIHVDDRCFLLKHPQALLIFPFQFHHGFNFQRSGLLWQFVTFEVKDAAPLDALRLAPLRVLDSSCLGLLSTLAGAWNDPARVNELTDWLALVLKRMLRTPSALPEERLAGPENQGSLMLRINHYCHAHLHRTFGLKEISAHLSVSESHLRARFREETGSSLGRHLRLLRLQKAMSLLLQSDLSITQVADRCGFDSIFTFSRSFRRFAGVTARDYRERFARSA